MLWSDAWHAVPVAGAVAHAADVSTQASPHAFWPAAQYDSQRGPKPDPSRTRTPPPAVGSAPDASAAWQKQSSATSHAPPVQPSAAAADEAQASFAVASFGSPSIQLAYVDAQPSTQDHVAASADAASAGDA